MRLHSLPILALLLAVSLCIFGCQGSTTTTPVVEASTFLDADSDAPTVELLAPEATLAIPSNAPTEDPREVASVVSGTTLLEGATASGGGYSPNPKTIGIAASPGEIVRVHLRAMFEGGGTGTASARINVPGYNTTFTFPTSNQWVYRAVYVPNLGATFVELFNSPEFGSALNEPGLQVEYYLQNTLALTADEPNADNKPTTTSDFTLASSINLGAITSRTLFFFSPLQQDVEEWYLLKKTVGARDLNVTLDNLTDRYNTWVWRISFHRQGTGELLGLPYVLRPPLGARSFRLHRLPAADTGVLMRIVASPTPVPTDTNLIHAVYSLYTSEPLQVLSASFRSGQNLADPNQSWTWATTHTGGDLPAAIWHWDTGGGATCTANCSSATPTWTFAAGGRYTARVWIENAGENSAVYEVPYTVRCRPNLTSTTSIWPDVLTWPNGNDGALLTGPGGVPYAIYQATSGELKFRTPSSLHHISNEVFPDNFLEEERRLAALVHNDHLFVAYQSSGGVLMFVSDDLTPTATGDWTRYVVDPVKPSGLIGGLVEHQGHLALAYRQGTYLTSPQQTVIATTAAPVPLSGSDWQVSPVDLNPDAGPLAVAGHAGYWWICSYDWKHGSDHLHRSDSLNPNGLSSWTTSDAPLEHGGSYLDSLQFFERDGQLAMSYSQRNYPIWNLYYAVAAVEVPNGLADWQVYRYPTTESLPSGHHWVQIIDDEFWLLYAGSGALRLMRSCDLYPELSGDWSVAAMDAYSLDDPPYFRFYGFSEPANDQLYVFLVDRYNFYYPTHNENALRRIPLSSWR